MNFSKLLGGKKGLIDELVNEANELLKVMSAEFQTDGIEEAASRKRRVEAKVKANRKEKANGKANQM